MRYLSVCSGIEAATVAWEPLGWETAAFAEIAPFPSAVLAYRFPSVPNLGDFTRITDEQLASMGTVGLLVGGTPCQPFSIAGLRQGLRDPRGNLALAFLGLALALRPQWIVWENVPGVLSSHGGRDFGTFLGALGKLGYGWAYRVLDAQYFGVAQRRRRVFVVGCLGDQRSAAEVLFEPDCVRRHTPPRRETGARVAGCLEARAGGGGFDPGAHGAASGHLVPAWPQAAFQASGVARWREGLGPLSASDDNGSNQVVLTGSIAPTLPASGAGTARTGNQRTEAGFLIAHTLRADGFDASEDGTGRGTPLVPVAIQERATSVGPGGPEGKGWQEGLAYTMEARRHPQAVAFDWQSGGDVRHNVSGDHNSALQANQTPAVAYQCHGSNVGPMGTLRSNAHAASGSAPFLNHGATAVRRITPIEAARLQGFPDGWTRVPYRGKSAEQCPDGPQYHAYGNSMAVPVVRWIGERIQHISDRASKGLRYD